MGRLLSLLKAPQQTAHTQTPVKLQEDAATNPTQSVNSNGSESPMETLVTITPRTGDCGCSAVLITREQSLMAVE